MDTFITIISWIAGLGTGFVLLLSLVFAGAGAAQTNNSELHIVSWVSSILLLWLLWTGVSSLYSYVIDDTASQAKTSYVQEVKTEPTTIVPSATNNTEYTLKGLYILMVLAFFAWLFIPSKSKKKGRSLVRNRLISLISFQVNEK